MPDTILLSPAGNFSHQMNKHIIDNGLTAAAVARRFGHSPSAVYQYTSGRAVPRPKYRPDLASALGVSLAQLESWCREQVVTTPPLPRDDLDDTLADLRGVLRQMPAQRWPVVVEIVRQVGRLS